jgi:hypothetical protein
MITTRLSGGLGNQMFQYAAGRRLALQHGVNLILDISWFEKEGLNALSARPYELAVFSIAGETSRQSSIAQASGGMRLKFWEKRPTIYHQYDDKYYYNPEILEASDNSVLDGFWQSQDYFADQADIIRKDFQIKKVPDAANKKILDQIKRGPAVSLHVRRGDYANQALHTAFHGLTTLDYYKEAIKLMTKELGSPTFFVFSDEPDWCKQNLKSKQPMVYVDCNDPAHGYADVRLMSSCDHHIVANSSFSWWGAWLNPSEKKTVIVPKRWFADSKAGNAPQLIPKDWKRL